MAAIIRLAEETDAEQLAAIYGPYCEQTSISFEETAPSAEEMRGRVAKVLAFYPWLVCEHKGLVAGYVYAGPHRERPAYRWSVDLSVYVRPEQQRCGVARALYTTLFHLLVVQGFFKGYAGITLPNPASVTLHEALGFTPVGVYRGVGFKRGAWHDVSCWQRTLQPEVSGPDVPVSFKTVHHTLAWAEALRVGLPLLHIA
jgi:phosphinothricin acetyltransferase